MQKKPFRLFCPKKHYMIHCFLIAMDDWWFVIVCCLIEDRSAKDHRAKHFQYCHDYHRSLNKFHRRLQQRKIPRCSLQEQSQSAWPCLYESRNDQGMITLSDATSMRQSAEGGMRAFQSSMPHLKDCMKFETRGERRVTLTMMILLYNLQA
jgi:hypothetical protein